MKLKLAIFAALASLAVFGVDKFIYSEDGATIGSSPRELPSQGVNLRTGEVVVGLQSLTDPQRAECGWWRIIPVPRPDTNHYWRVTNYVFAAGTATQIWSEYVPPKRPAKYSKLSIIRELKKIPGAPGDANAWATAKAGIAAYGLEDEWAACTYIEEGDPAFAGAKEQFASLIGLTVKQLDDILAKCIY